jgi:hypothetical protein
LIEHRRFELHDPQEAWIIRNETRRLRQNGGCRLQSFLRPLFVRRPKPRSRVRRF